MKTKIYFNQLANLLIILILSSCMILASCQEKEETNMLLDPVLENDYDGTLVVEFTNIFPPFSETSLGMEVAIAGDIGMININEGTLYYDADTIFINNHGEEDSKLKRCGFWIMNPAGELRTAGGINYIDVEPNIQVDLDIQVVYAKDEYGTWIEVSRIDFSDNYIPNYVLTFVLEDAISESSVVEIADGMGSITWTLSLIEAP